MFIVWLVGTPYDGGTLDIYVHSMASWKYTMTATKNESKYDDIYKPQIL